MLSELSNQASVWIFQANRQLKAEDCQYIHTSLQQFVPEWAAHGVSLKADFEIADNLFVIIGVDESHAQASGCSKDTLTRQIKSIGEQLKIDFFDRLLIAYENENNEIELVDMLTFKKLVQKDIIRQNTTVYNNLVTTKHELLTNWKVKVVDSWHSNLMPIL